MSLGAWVSTDVAMILVHNFGWFQKNQEGEISSLKAIPNKGKLKFGMHRKITVGIAKQQPWQTIRGCLRPRRKIIICIWRVRLQLNHQMYYVLCYYFAVQRLADAPLNSFIRLLLTRYVFFNIVIVCVCFCRERPEYSIKVLNTFSRKVTCYNTQFTN